MKPDLGRRILSDLANTSVKIINKERSSDTKDDWGDYEKSYSTISANVVVTRSAGNHTPDPSGPVIETEADYLVPNNLTVRDGGGTLPASVILENDQRYEVKQIDSLYNGCNQLFTERSSA